MFCSKKAPNNISKQSAAKHKKTDRKAFFNTSVEENEHAKQQDTGLTYLPKTIKPKL